MSNAMTEGAYLLERIRARCVEEGECWIWQGATVSGHPIMKPKGRSCTTVRRLVAEAKGTPPEHRQPVVPACGEPLCVNPEHIKLTTVRAVARAAAKRGAYSNPLRHARIAKTRRERHSKLTWEQVRAVRASEEPARVWAERLGVNKSLIHRIRRGDCWREFGANPWAGMGAR